MNIITVFVGVILANFLTGVVIYAGIRVHRNQNDIKALLMIVACSIILGVSVLAMPQ